MAGKCLPIFVELDFWVGLCIFKIGATDMLVLLFFATIIANNGGPGEALRSCPTWPTLLLKTYCRMADVNQEIRVQLVKSLLSGDLRVKIPYVSKKGQSQTKSL